MKKPDLPELFAVVERVVRILEDIGIPYHLTGGLVSSFYGDPRFTQDIDVVVRLDPSKGDALATALQFDFQVDSDLLKQAAVQNDMFQALDRKTFIKIDFHVGEEVPDELSRSERVEIVNGLEVNVPSIEDAIASKLHWIRLGSHRSRDDVIGLLQSGNPIDHVRLLDLCRSMQLQDLLEEMIKTAGTEAG